MELLKELCEASGVPGREERPREITRRELTPLADEIRVDALGNLIALVKARPGKGRKKTAPRRLMLAAHMDEIGFYVNFIDDKGRLRLVPVGGHDPRNMMAQRVTVAGTKRDLPGLLYPALKPPHIQTDAERAKELTVQDYYVDLYMPVARVKREVEIGAMVTLDRQFAQIGDGFSCKAMDDRLAVYVMIEAVRRAKRFAFDTYAVATTQEEVGLRGATVGAFGVEPDVGVALDVTIAADIPGVPEHEQVTRLGDGVAIKLLDSSSISHPGLVEMMKSLARKRKIRHQMEILPRGGTDAGALQRTHAGVPVITLSIPTRYVHSPNELVDRKDVESAIKLLAAFLEEGDGVRLETS